LNEHQLRAKMRRSFTRVSLQLLKSQIICLLQRFKLVGKQLTPYFFNSKSKIGLSREKVYGIFCTGQLNSTSKVHKAFFLYDPIYIFGRILHIEIARVKEQLYKHLHPEDTG